MDSRAAAERSSAFGKQLALREQALMQARNLLLATRRARSNCAPRSGFVARELANAITAPHALQRGRLVSFSRRIAAARKDTFSRALTSERPDAAPIAERPFAHSSCR